MTKRILLDQIPTDAYSITAGKITRQVTEVLITRRNIPAIQILTANVRKS